MSLRKIVSALTIFCALCLVAAAQDRKLSQDANSRTLQGVVSDVAGKPVSGAVVQLKDTKTLAIRSFVTHEDGQYHFAGLSTNQDYQVKAEAPGGKSSPTKTLSLYDGRKAATIDLKLK